MLKHYRGKKENYSYELETPTTAHENGIYFTNDTHEILMNGEVYSGATYADIEISGGPLASHITDAAGSNWPWKNDSDKKIIPAGKTLQEILTTLLLQEYWPSSITHQQGSISTSVNAAPSISLGSSGTVEIGSTVTATVTPNNKTKVTTTNSTLSGFTSNQGKGYSDSKTGTIVNANSISKALTNIKILQNDVTKRTASIEVKTSTGGVTANSPASGWSNGNITLTNEVSDSAAISNNLIDHGLSSVTFSFKVKSGSNTVNATETGVCAQGMTQSFTEDYYLVSSLGNRDDQHKHTEDYDIVYNADGSVKSEGTLKTVANKPTKSASQASVTGAYYSFYGRVAAGSSTPTAPVSSSSHTGYDKNFTAPTTFTLKSSDPDTMRIVIYTTKTPSKIIYLNPANSSYGGDNLIDNKNMYTFTKDALDFTLPDGSKVKYNKIDIHTLSAGGEAEANFSKDANSKITITY